MKKPTPGFSLLLIVYLKYICLAKILFAGIFLGLLSKGKFTPVVGLMQKLKPVWAVHRFRTLSIIIFFAGFSDVVFRELFELWSILLIHKTKRIMCLLQRWGLFYLVMINDLISVTQTRLLADNEYVSWDSCIGSLFFLHGHLSQMLQQRLGGVSRGHVTFWGHGIFKCIWFFLIWMLPCKWCNYKNSFSAKWNSSKWQSTYFV